MRAKDSIRPQRWFSAAVLGLALATATPGLAQSQRPADWRLSYTELLRKIQQNQVAEMTLNRQSQVARVRLKDRPADEPPLEVRVFDHNPELLRQIRQAKVKLTVVDQPSNRAMMGLLVNVLLGLLLLLLLIALLRRLSNAPGGPGQALSFGQSRARFQMAAKTGVKFDDVAGIEEAKEELQRW